MGYYQEILKYAFQEPPSAASGIIFVKNHSANAFTDSGTTTITGLQSGDFALALAGEDAGGAPTTPPTATNIYSANLLHNTTMWYEFATGTSITQNIGNSGDEECSITYLVFRGVSQATPLDVSVTTPTNTGNVSTITPPSVTTVTNGCMIVPVMSLEDENVSGAVTYDSSYTLGIDFYGADGDVTQLMLYKLQSTAGAESPSAFSWNAANVDVVHTTTVALRPASKPEFTYIYWEATLGSPNTNFYVYCEFDVTNSDRPTSAVAYVTIDGSTPSSSNNETSATLSDTSAGSDGSTWDSSVAIGFNSSGVSTSDVVKVLIVATNDQGTTDSVVVSLTVATIGNNNTEYTYP